MQVEVVAKAKTESIAEEKASTRNFQDRSMEVFWCERPEDFGSLYRWRGVGLATADCLAVATSMLLAYLGMVFIEDAVIVMHLVKQPAALSVPIVALPVLLWCSLSWGHYLRIKPFWTETRELLKMIFYTAAVVATALVALNIELPRLWIFGTLAFMCVLCPLGRLFAKFQLERLQAWYAPLVVVGDIERVRACSEAIASDRTLGYQVVVTVEIKDVVKENIRSDDNLYFQLISALESAASAYAQPRLLLAFNRYDRIGNQQSFVDSISGKFRHVIVGRPMHGMSAANAEVLNIDKYDTLFVRMSSGGIGAASKLVKRSLDIALSLAALVVLSPVLFIIAFIVRFDGGPALFSSQRIGQGGKLFGCLKFRSMRADAEQVLAELLASDAKAREEWNLEFKLKNDPRITPLGHFLRKTSLDELPQLFNVIKGEMSLVGPRPILPDEVFAYGDRLSGYQGVSPGVTGLWQISGRDQLKYEDRIALNLWYVRNWSLWLDFTILLRTANVLLGSKDAS